MASYPLQPRLLFGHVGRGFIAPDGLPELSGNKKTLPDNSG